MPRIRPLAPAYPEPEAITQVRLMLHRCRLDRRTLDRLVDAASDGFAPLQVTVAASREDTRFAARDLTKLVGTVGRRCLEPGAAEALDNLKIEAVGVGRAVQISITDAGVSATVVAADKDWARGRAYELTGLLQHAGGKPSPVRWGGAYYARLVGLFGVVAATEAPASRVPAPGAASLLAAGLAVVALTTAAYVLGNGRKERARTRLNLTGSLPDPSWWRATPVNQKIAMASVLLGVASVVIELLRVFH
jgi:hypothetical protein